MRRVALAPAVTTLQAQTGSAREAKPAPIVLLDGGADRLLCFFGGHYRELPRATGQTLDAVAALEQDWIARLHTIEMRKRHFAESFLIFVEHLNRLWTAPQVHEALLQHIPPMMGVWAAVLLLPAPGSPSALQVVGDVRIGADFVRVPAEALAGAGPLLVIASDTREGYPLAALAPLFERCRAHHVAGISLGDFGSLLVVERRTEREFDGEDWFRLQAVARHGERVLERIQLSDQARAPRRMTRPRRRPPRH